MSPVPQPESSESPRPTPERSFQEWFKLGQTALEYGAYAEAIVAFESALDQGYPQSYAGGQAQIWLATAYEAKGQPDKAREICRRLTHHPDSRIRKQSADVLYIWEAPVLTRRDDWVVKIPDLSQVDTATQGRLGESRRSQTQKTVEPTPTAPPEPFDLENRGQNNFWIWAILGAGLLLWLMH